MVPIHQLPAVYRAERERELRSRMTRPLGVPSGPRHPRAGTPGPLSSEVPPRSVRRPQPGSAATARAAGSA